MGHRGQQLLAREPDTGNQGAAPKSAARLAAEAAFALPETSAWPQQPAQVSVRRARFASLVQPPSPEGEDGPTTELAIKGSRVFRVEAEAAAPVVNTLDPALPPAPSPAHPTERRIASDKRPGPVSHVVHALPERQPEAATLQRRLGLLWGDLQGVMPDLGLIAHAQAFSLVDEHLTDEWLHLSEQVDALHAQIQNQAG